MLRYRFLLILLLFAAVPTLNQAPRLPFMYVIDNPDVENNVFVMDALTGQDLYMFATETGICPLSVSDDGQTLIYRDNVNNWNYSLDLSTGEGAVLESGYLYNVVWSDRYNLVAYHYFAHEVNYINVYGTTNQRQLFNAYLPNAATYQTSFRLIGSNLFYAVIPMNGNQMTFQRVERLYHEPQVFDLEVPENWSRIQISPNGQYVLGFGIGQEVSVLDVETGIAERIGEGTDETVGWLPNADAVLGYLQHDDAGTIELLRYDLAAEEQAGQELIGIHPFRFSPDGAYLIYQLSDSDDSQMAHYFLMDTETSEQFEIALMPRWLLDMRWLSASQFVYRYASPDSGERYHTDLYFYDAETHESRQLTDTPELTERFDCFSG